MLPKINRLTKQKDFEILFKGGRSFKNKFLALRVIKNNTEEIKIGFVVSQKVSKKAVVRNKVKRRLRESVKPILSEIKKGQNIAVIALPGAEEADFSEINENIKILFKKSGLYV